MFSLFVNRQFKDVERIVDDAIAEEVCPNGVLSDADRMYLAKTAKMIARPGMKSLPKHVRDECHNFMLAAYVLLAEAALYAKKTDSQENAQMYLNAARKLTLRLGPMMSSGRFQMGDVQLMKGLQKVAKESGLDFGAELLEGQDEKSIHAG